MSVSYPKFGRTFNVGQPAMVHGFIHNYKWVPAIVSVLRGPANYMVNTDDEKVQKCHINQIDDRISAQPSVMIDSELFVQPHQVYFASANQDIPAQTRQFSLRFVPESFPTPENTQPITSSVQDAQNVVSPSGISPLPSQEESVSVSLSHPVRPTRVGKQHLEDFVC